LRRSPSQGAAQRIPEPLAAPLAAEAEAADEQAKRTAIDRPQLAAVARLIDESATRGARLATRLLAAED
jgi:hypothetical protein